jgi:pimeloyl-ACP methyl ester carboxylesterase/DNA-binding winged helix-turn-helix (wHTH) protein
MVRRNIDESAIRRANATASRMEANLPKNLHFAGWTLNLARLSLEGEGREISLRPKSFEVLRYLAANPGRVVTKDELIGTVWSGTFVTDDSLVQCIKDIREAICDQERRIVKTLPRRGYLFAAVVTDGATSPISADSVSPIRFAKSGEVHIAYRVWGEGPRHLVFCPGFVTHIENAWTEPGMARFLRRMGQFARVIMFDKRGTGMSDRVDKVPGLDERVDDLRAVLDAVDVERAAIIGPSEGGSLAAYFAATHRHRCEALVLYGAFARFASWIRSEEALQGLLQYIDTSWGSGASLPMFAPSMVGNAAFQEWWRRFERLGATPAAAMALMRLNSKIDITDILPSIRVPTLVIHRTADVCVDIEGGRQLAASIPNARLVELPGADHLPWVGDNADEILWRIEEFLAGREPAGAVRRPSR